MVLKRKRESPELSDEFPDFNEDEVEEKMPVKYVNYDHKGNVAVILTFQHGKLQEGDPDFQKYKNMYLQFLKDEIKKGGAIAPEEMKKEKKLALQRERLFYIERGETIYRELKAEDSAKAKAATKTVNPDTPEHENKKSRKKAPDTDQKVVPKKVEKKINKKVAKRTTRRSTS